MLPHLLLLCAVIMWGWTFVATKIISATPLALAVLSFLFLRERIGWSGVAGIAVATVGILLLVSRGSLTNVDWLRSTGDWLMSRSAP